MTKLKYFIPPIIWAMVIFWFSSLTTNPVSTVYWQEFAFKKTAHLVEYAVFATLLYRAFRNTIYTDKASGYAAVLVSFLYGLSDEYHQSFTPGRGPAIRDVFFDTIGATLAIFIIWNILPTTFKQIKKLAKALEIL